MTDQPAAPTPGPWTLETVKTSCGICHKIGPFPWTDTEKNHACIYVDDRMAWKYGPELEANARLIAASWATAAERDRLKLEIEQCHAKSTCCCGDYMKHHSTHSGHNPVSMYDSALFNIETERDRLKVVNEGLVKALETLRPMCGAPHDYTIADVWKAQQFADAALDEARK